MVKSIEFQFWAKVDKTGTCWVWNGVRLNHGGYGQFRDSPTTRIVAHRFAYEMLVGPIPEGLQLDHLCRVPWCVNPAHLEPVTQLENLARGVAATRRYGKNQIESAAENIQKTRCPRGHQYTPENTRQRGHGRECRTCERVRSLDRYYAKKNAGLILQIPDAAIDAPLNVWQNIHE